MFSFGGSGSGSGTASGSASSGLEMPDREQRTAIFSRMDNNGNGMLSLAEIDKAVLELWPTYDHKPALMRAYKAADVNNDGFIRRREFRLLLKYIIYFNGLWEKFDSIDSNHDHRLDLAEFTAGCGLLGIKLSRAEAELEFYACDTDGGGMVLFDEFCSWCAKRQVAVAGEGLTPMASPGSSAGDGSPSKRTPMDLPTTPEPVSSRATARAVSEKRQANAASPPHPVFHIRQKHKLRSSEKAKPVKGIAAKVYHPAFGSGKASDRLIHSDDHPHMINDHQARRSTSPSAIARIHPVTVRRSPVRRSPGGRSISPVPLAVPEAQRQSPARSPTVKQLDIHKEEEVPRPPPRAVSPPRGPSPVRMPKVHQGNYHLNKLEKQQREHANVLRVIQQAVAAKRSLNGQTMADTRAVFAAMDRDSSGNLDETELTNAMKRLGLGLTLEQVHGLVVMMDRDGDGTLDYEELLSYINGDIPLAPEGGYDAKGFADKKEPEPEPVRPPRTKSRGLDGLKEAGGSSSGSPSGSPGGSPSKRVHAVRAVATKAAAAPEPPVAPETTAESSPIAAGCGFGCVAAALCVALAVVLLLASDITGAQALRRNVLQELQHPSEIDLADLMQGGGVSAEHEQRRPALTIVGGSGPEAGLDLAGKVLAANRRQLAAQSGSVAVGDLLAPRFTLLSVPELGLSMDLADHEEQVWSTLRSAYLELASAPSPRYASWVAGGGCEGEAGERCEEQRTDVFAIACITLHYFEPRLQALRDELMGSPLRLLAAPPPVLVSPTAVVGRKLAARKPAPKTVALLGSKSTMDLESSGKSPFRCGQNQTAAAHCGDWTYEVPDDATQERLQELILSIKRQSTGAKKAQLLEIVESLSSDVVLIACTELPLLLTEVDEGDSAGEVVYGGKTLVDVTAVLAGELAQRLLPLPAAEK